MKKNKVKDSTFLVTGGAGFIGSYVVEELLLLKPKKIFIVDNMVRGSLKNTKTFINNSRIELFQDDISNIHLMAKLMSKADYCFHLAALRINACAADPQRAFEVMVRSTFNMVENAKKYRIKKFIYSSSASVYGLTQHFPTPETDNPYDNKTMYGAAKLFGEQLLRSYHHMYGLDYIGLRYFNVYGPRMDTEGKYTEVLIKWLDCILHNINPAIRGDGLTSMDFVYVTDVANANILALLTDVSDEVFNIASNRETNLKQLLTILLKVNRSILRPKFEPETTINPVKRRWADISKAKKMLGYKPRISLAKGLKLLSDWYFHKL